MEVEVEVPSLVTFGCVVGFTASLAANESRVVAGVQWRRNGSLTTLDVADRRSNLKYNLPRQRGQLPSLALTSIPETLSSHKQRAAIEYR